MTGDEIATKAVNDLYRDGFDRIWGKPRKPIVTQDEFNEWLKVAVKEPGNTGSSVLEDGKDDPEPV